MTEEIARIGLRMFSEGEEFNLGVQEFWNDTMWKHETKCPHYNKSITVLKWIDKLIGFKL